MSTGYASCIYGINLSDRRLSSALERAQEEEMDGFHSPYCGCSEPFAFGADMNAGICEWDEDINPESFTVTDEHKAEFQRLFDALDKDIQDELKAIAEEEGKPMPYRFLLWSRG